MAEPVRVTLYNDAGCPWGYSANPAFRVLEWRYGTQLEWRLVLIGLTNVAQEYVDRGYTPLRSAEGYARRFRRFGMPLAPNPRPRIVGTGRSCRAIVAVRLQAPGREWAAFRALQFAFFTTTLLLDEDEGIATALRGVDGIDVDAVIAAIDTPGLEEAYQQDRAEARTAARVRERWEAIKTEQEGRDGIFHDVPESLPALLRARKVQRRAAAVGYDWPDLDGPAAKVREELDELLAEVARAGRPRPETEPDRRVEAELGDLLFTIVNLARFVNVDPELALRATTGRFVNRVELAERLAAEAGETWTELDLEGQERWYERAKTALD